LNKENLISRRGVMCLIKFGGNWIMKYYVITVDDGSKWGVPAETIADNRAKYYAKIDSDTTYQEEFDAMMHWFDTGDFEFADWAKNNMDFSDVKDKAVKLSSALQPTIDWDECWMNGEYEYKIVE